MPKYEALADTWLSHENRLVKAGTVFETTFPTVNGKAMALGKNLKLAKTTAQEQAEAKAAAKAAEEAEAKAKADAKAKAEEDLAAAKKTGDKAQIEAAQAALDALEAPLV